ncbi:MAG: Ig-like domain-containing protein [Thermoflexales bacterium]|nr:Ig-like domain-containing protein [Thermoflexales bacterium]
MTQQTVVNPSISTSGPVSLTQRAGAEMTDLRGEAGKRVLWLKLDESASATSFADSSLHGNDGACSGTRCPTAGTSGYIGKAVQFDGVDDAISIPRPVADDFTIAFWFKSDQWVGFDNQWWDGMGLVDGNVAGEANDFGVSLGNGRVLFGAGSSGTTVKSEFVADDEWHHVAATRDKESGIIRLYIDGDQIGHSHALTASLTSPPSLRIGSLQTGANFFKGLIDDVQIYPTTLDANQVMALYSQAVFKLSLDKLECTPAGGLTRCSTRDEAGDVPVQAICLGSECPQSVPGVRKRGVQLNGVPLSVDYASALKLSSGDFSQSVWIKPTDSTTAGRQGVWGYSPRRYSDSLTYRGDPSETAYPSIFITGTDGLEVGFGNKTEWQPCVLADVLTLNEWNHIVATYDYNPATGGGTYTVYVNGQLKGTCGLNGKPPNNGQFDLGRATHCAQVENPRVYCINEPGDGGDSAEFYGYFDDDGYDRRWWGVIEGVDSDESFNTGAEPHDYCGETTLKVEEYDEGGGDDFIGGHTFDYSQPTRMLFAHVIDEPGGDGKLRLYLSHTNPSIPFEGSMDELALYRRALSADEVQSLYLAAERVFEIDLDETPGRAEFADATTNGYTATCNPQATCPASGLPGRFNQAARFDGADDSLSLNTPDGVGGGTIAAWVQRTPGGKIGYKPIVSYKESGGCGFGLGLDNNGVPQAQITTLPWIATTVKDSTPVPEYTWVHLAAIYDGVLIHLYRDGELVGETAALNAYMSCAGQTTIGSRTVTGQGTGYFKGYLDQVVMLNRALSAEQVSALSQEAPVTSLHLDEPLYEPLTSTPTSHFDNAAQVSDTYDATCTACPAAGQKGWMRQAAVFDGTQYLTKRDDDITPRGGFSVGGWFKLSKELTTTNQVLASKDSFSLYVPGSAETVTRTLVYFGVEGLAPSQVLKPSPDYPGLMLNQWTYILATYNSDSDVATLYVNGHKVGESNLGPSTYGPSELSIGQNLVGQADEVTVYNYPLHSRAIKHIYEYQVHWYDTAVSHNITVDADDPVISLEMPAYITNRDMVLAAVASDATSAVTGVEYQLDGGGWQVPPTRDYAAWAWTFNPTHNLSEGPHTLELRATDSVGNVGYLTKLFNVDITGPEIHLGPALVGDDVVLDTSRPLNLYGTATDGGSGVDKVFITLLDGLGHAASSPLLASLSGNNWQVTYTATVALNGHYTVQMDATDRLGNLSTNTQQRMTAFGARGSGLRSASIARSVQTVAAQAEVQLDSSPPLADVYDVTTNGWALSGTLDSGLPVISGTLSALPYPTGQILAMHMEEPAGATRFQDAGPGHALGTCEAGDCPQAGSDGRFGSQAASFDGGDSINLGPNRRLGELAGAGSFSLLAWVHPTDTAGLQHLLGATPVVSPNTGFDWRLANGQSRLQVFGDKIYSTTGSLPTGQWTHLAAVMAPLAEGGSALTFYVDGVPAQTITSTLSGQVNTGDDWLIGYGFQGQLDELVVYGRPLSADQILALAHPASTGVDRLEVGLYHLKDWGNTDAIQWSTAALGQAGEIFSTWSYTVPAQIEGTHQLYLRATDRLSHSLSLPNVWQGEIDTAAPQARLAHVAPRFPGDIEFYRCQAWDYNLVETGYTCPVPGSTPTYHDEPWFTAVFSYLRPYTVTSPLVGVLEASPADHLTACDGVGQCTTVERDTTAISWTLGVAILTPTASLVISQPATPLSVEGAAYAADQLQDLHLSLGSQAIYTTSWAAGTQQAAWNTTYTPTIEGAHPLLASLSDRAGGVITSAAPIGDLPGPLSLVYVDFTPPDVSLETSRINSANFDNGVVRVSGLVTEATKLASLQVRLDDASLGNDSRWQDATYSEAYPLVSQPWTAGLYSTLTAPPEGRSYTLTVRATDVAGRVAEIMRVVPADAVPPEVPVTVTLTYSAGLPVTPGMTIAGMPFPNGTVSPELSLAWTSSASPDLAGYTVEWLNDPQSPTPSHVEQSITLPFTATRQARFTASQQSKLWARLSSLDAFDNPAVSQIGPVYVDNELTPVYVDMGEGEASGMPYEGWLQAECNQLGQDNRSARRSLPSGTGQQQAFYAAWDREGLRMTWSGADWKTDGNLFIYLDTAESGKTLAYDPFNKYGDDVYLPTYRIQTTTYRMAADFVVRVTFSATAPLSTSAQLLRYNGSSWVVVPNPGIEYAFDAGTSPAMTDLYVPFADLGITNPVSQSLGLVAFATEPDSLRLWAAAPAGNKLNSQWVTGQSPNKQPWGLSQRYYWPSLGDGVCPCDGERSTSSQVQVSLDTGGLGIGYSLLGNGLPVSVSDYLATLTGWGSVQNSACFAEPNAPDCVPQIDTSTPVSAKIQALLAHLSGVNAQALGNGQPLSVTVRLENTGKSAAEGVRIQAQSWGHLRLTGITQTIPITLPAGSWITQTLSGVVDLAHDPDHDSGWATLGVVVLDNDSVPNPPGRYIYPLDWLYADYEIDQAGPEYVAIKGPDPAIGLVGLGETVFQGVVRDPSSVPTITLQIDTYHRQSGYPPLITDTLTFTCVDPTPGDGQWTCPVTVEQLVDQDWVYVKARAADIYGQSSSWSIRRQYMLDALSPTLSLGSETQAALSDGWIGPNETAWTGGVADNRLLEALDICDPESSRCTRLEDMVPANQLPFEIIGTENVAEGTGTWIPRCDLGNSTIFLRLSTSNRMWDVGVGLVISHPNRSDLKVELVYGGGSDALRSLLAAPGVGSPLLQTYNVAIDDTAALPLWKDGTDHTTTPPYYEAVRRPSASFDVFRIGSSYASNTWQLLICDTQGNSRGVYLRSRLTVKNYASGYQRATSGSWRYSLPAASLDGVTQTRQLVAIDSVGLRSPTTTLSYRVDTVAPVLTVTHALTDVDRLYLNGSVSDGGGVRLMRVRMTLPDGGQYATVIPTTGGNWLYRAVPSPYQAGDYVVWIEAEDWVGNLTYTGPFNLSLPPQPNRITQVSPADGATNVALNQPIVIDFSQAMEPGSFNLDISPTLVLTPSWNAEKTRVNLSHPYMVSNTAYRLVVPLGTANQDNQFLENVPYTWTFTTGATIANEADLSVSLGRVGSGDVTAGDLITYTATITNNGPVSISSALLTFNFGPADSLAWAGGPGCNWTLGTELMTCTVGLSGFTPVSLTVTVRNTNWEGVFRNTADVAPPAGIIDPNALNNTAGPVTVAVNKLYYIYLPVVLKGI